MEDVEAILLSVPLFLRLLGLEFWWNLDAILICRDLSIIWTDTQQVSDKHKMINTQT